MQENNICKNLMSNSMVGYILSMKCDIVINYSALHFRNHSSSALSPRWVGLVVCVSASHAVVRRFAPGQVTPQTILKWYKLPPCLPSMRKGRSLTV